MIVLIGPFALIVFFLAAAFGKRPLSQALTISTGVGMALWVAFLLLMFIQNGEGRWRLLDSVIGHYSKPMLFFTLACALLGVGARRGLSLLSSLMWRNRS